MFVSLTEIPNSKRSRHAIVLHVYVAWLGTTPMLGSQPEPCNSLFVLGEGCQKKERSIRYLPENIEPWIFR